ncbi:MAG: N-6 DNA methylase [Chloroflexales bacterium]|nr:N-6 DNA methylase [Chloroflexales bacterium]
MSLEKKLSSSLPLVEQVMLLRDTAVSKLSSAKRRKFGQYFSSVDLARLMASQIEIAKEEVTILDPGAGFGILFSAIVERLCVAPNKPKKIRVIAFEINEDLSGICGDSMKRCEQECVKAGIDFRGSICKDNFLIKGVSMILKKEMFPDIFADVIILNPPYRKLSVESDERQIVRTIGVDTPNLYTAFLVVAIEMLQIGGQIVAVVPRSFCSGDYFLNFRRHVLSKLDFRYFRLFSSRERVFEADQVLQETLVFSARRSSSRSKEVVVSHSLDAQAQNATHSVIDFQEVVWPGDGNAYFRFPSGVPFLKASNILSNLRGTLADIGLFVSTGPVVDFRATKYLTSNPNATSFPLIYPFNLKGGSVVWPKSNPKKKIHISSNAIGTKLLLPNAHYVLVKRFSTTEEHRRIVASLYDPQQFSNEYISFENHLNYYHSKDGLIDRLLAKGLTVYLNSSIIDEYIRKYNGHTQINASDLRNLPYPTANQLRRLGEQVSNLDISQKEIDEITCNILSN